MVPKKVAAHDLKGEYVKLLEHMKTQDLSGALCGFRYLVGSDFGRSKSKLLICGRAVDGWRKSFNAVELESLDINELINKIFHIPEPDLESGNNMNWIVRNYEYWKKGDKKKYNYKKSKFWNYSISLLGLLDGKKYRDNEWTKNLAWTNVYKISPKKGNPHQELRSIQIPFCKNILKKEIDELEPYHILFITGDWGKDIISSLGIKPDFQSFNNDAVVQFCGKLASGSKVVIANRPERKKKAIWVNDIYQAFKSIS